MNKFLVITPFHNVEECLEQMIEGVLQQEYKNIHLCLIDDCSTDNSYKIAESYKNHSNVTLLQNKENRGAYYSINKALHLFKDEEWDFWHFHGADDVSDLTRIQKINTFLLENPSIVGLKTTFFRVHFDTKKMNYENGRPHISTSEGTAFYSRKIFSHLGYYHDSRFSSDTDYWWRLEAFIQTNPELGFSLGEHTEPLKMAYLRRGKDNLTLKYDFHTTRPKYWQSVREEIYYKMIPSNNFYRNIFD